MTEVAVNSDVESAGVFRAEFAPSDPAAATALRTLRAGRHAPAAKLVAALSDAMALARAWKHFMQAELARGRQAIAEEEGELLMAVGVLEAIGCNASTPGTTARANETVIPGTNRVGDSADGAGNPTEARRLMVHALTHLGRIFRRREDSDSARRIHLRAWQYVSAIAMHDDHWMVATELGLDEDVAGHLDDARSWHARAAELAQGVGAEPHAKHARSATLLANTLWAASDAAGSIESARQACAAWRRHDASTVQVPRADLFLAGRLLDGAGQALESDNLDEAQARAGEALSLLKETREALAAFAAPARLDLALCDELLEFAGRLNASLAAS